MATAMVPIDTLRDFLNAFNRHDVDAVMEFFADDCILEMPRGPDPNGKRLVGKSEVRRGIESRFAGIPDVQYRDDRHWVCGNRGVSEWLITGHDPEGRPIRVRGCDLLEFEDGRIRRKDSYWKIVEQT